MEKGHRLYIENKYYNSKNDAKIEKYIFINIKDNITSKTFFDTSNLYNIIRVEWENDVCWFNDYKNRILTLADSEIYTKKSLPTK